MTKAETTEGICYQQALQQIQKLGNVPDAKLVQGNVTGQGPIAGVRYGHAWIEIGDTVIDPSTGFAGRKEDYYKAGKIVESELDRYTSQEAATKAVETGHYGPWNEAHVEKWTPEARTATSKGKTEAPKETKQVAAQDFPSIFHGTVKESVPGLLKEGYNPAKAGKEAPDALYAAPMGEKGTDASWYGDTLLKVVPKKGETINVLPIRSKLWSEVYGPSKTAEESAAARAKLKAMGVDAIDYGNEMEILSHEKFAFERQKPLVPVGPPPFKGLKNLSTKVVESLKGRTTVSRQFIEDSLKQQGVTKNEREAIQAALADTEGKTVNVKEFADRVKTELLPLKLHESATMNTKKALTRSFEPGRENLREPRWESIVLPEELRGPVADYSEHIFSSPIKTSAGDVHFRGSNIVEPDIFGDYTDLKKADKGAANYFAHTRVEDMASEPTKYVPGSFGSGAFVGKSKKFGEPIDRSGIRRVLEVQSDLFQKGRLENEASRGLGDTKVVIDEKGTQATIVDVAKDQTIVKIPTTETERAASSGHMARTEFIDTNRLIELNPTFKKKLDEHLLNIGRLAPYENTWHERIIREEIKRAAKDGKTALQFPTGETAMKIEGLGTENHAWTVNDRQNPLSVNMLKVGKEINQGAGINKWVITEVLDNGRFRAIDKRKIDDFLEEAKSIGDDVTFREALEMAKENDLDETFDISGEIDKENPIYKFYEGTIGKYLKNRHGAKLVTDPQGVTWWEVPIKKEQGKMPVEAFGVLPPTAALAAGRKKDEKK